MRALADVPRAGWTQVQPAPYVVKKEGVAWRDWVVVQQHRRLAALQQSVQPPLPPPPPRSKAVA